MSEAAEMPVIAEVPENEPQRTHPLGFLLRAILADMLDRPLPDFAGLGGLPNCAHSIVDVDAAGGGRVRTIDSLPPHEGLWAALFAPPAMTGATTEATTGAATDAAAERRATR